MLGVIFLGVRSWQDRKVVAEKVQQEMDKAVIAMQYKFDKRYDEDRASLRKELDGVRKQIAEIWLRNVVTSPNKDPYAIKKAIELAIESESRESILPMVQELHSYAMKSPEIVGGFIWEIQKFGPVLEQAKELFKDDTEYLKMVTDYTTEIEMIAAENKAKKEAIKRKLDANAK
ncbi:MAG: hypothetical protein JWO30_3176 [Fibrobacteres bacterium]|nr:hypothetical protein [Fibrobacterota bacterium]